MHIQRRPLIAGGMALLATPRTASPQATGKVWRVGVLQQYGAQEWFEPIQRQLLALGYAEGKNIVFDYRLAHGDRNRLDALAAELVAARVDLIVTALTPEAQAAKRVTKSIPI